MTIKFTTTADKSGSFAGKDSAPYSPGEAYGKLVEQDEAQDTEISNIKTVNAAQDTTLNAIKDGSIATTWNTGLPDAVDDAGAATAGVAVGGLYRSGSTVKVRVA